MRSRTLLWLTLQPPTPVLDATQLPEPPARWAPRALRHRLVKSGSRAPAEKPTFRCWALHGLVHAAVTCFLEVFSAFAIVSTQLITAETILLTAYTAATVVAYSRWFPLGGDGGGVNLNWTFVSALWVWPLTFSVNEAFRRRERAGVLLLKFHTAVLSLALGFRASAGAGDAALLLAEARVLYTACESVLTSPTVSHSRHGAFVLLNELKIKNLYWTSSSNEHRSDRSSGQC